MSNNPLATGVFQGGDFGFGHEDIISANSSNGISHILFDSRDFGSGQIEGNTSVDNFNASTVPEPATLIALGGLALLAFRRRSK
jgi:hypothetical protein